MKKITIHLLLLTLLACSQNSTPLALKLNDPLPPISEIYTFGIRHQNPTDDIPSNWFTPELLRETYPKLVPAKVEVPTGFNITGQSGVIVTKNKEVLFWSSFENSYISIETPNGTLDYGITNNIRVFSKSNE